MCLLECEATAVVLGVCWASSQPGCVRCVPPSSGCHAAADGSAGGLCSAAETGATEVQHGPGTTGGRERELQLSLWTGTVDWRTPSL